jgi:hypothetical protein
MEGPISLFDFIVSLAESVFSPNGKQESPYDVNFTNHYTRLYDLEETCRNDFDQELNITQIEQDKKTKSINVRLNSSLNKKTEDRFKEYCNTHNVEYNISKGKLKDITITKNTKGVMEERKWK